MLYAGSVISWKIGNRQAAVHEETNFPYDNKVKLVVKLQTPLSMKLHVRIPRWAEKDIVVRVDGKKVVTGKPGTYVTLDRRWHNGDEVSFTLPVSFRLIKYEGMDGFAHDGDHYALQYGPLLMAVVGNVDDKGNTKIELSPDKVISHLIPEQDKPLHFKIKGDHSHEYIPYFMVQSGKSFSCYPEINKVL